MNKELIKKYKAEFDYWLNDGKILCRKTDSLKHTWGLVEKHDKNPIEEGYIYAINDKYTEFRKALAEGKTVQVDVNYWAFPETDVKNYKDLPKDFTSWKKYEVSCYRIKPEESDIKVGDYIYDIQYKKYYKIEEVLPDRLGTATFRVWRSSLNDIDYKLWKPNPGELVIMETDDYSTGFTVTPWEENAKFSPVPFTGELPK